MPLISLSAMTVGQSGRVAGFLKEDTTSQRLLEMGITLGVTIEVVRFAPLGDPINIKVRGYHLSLRRKEAEFIQVDIS